MPPASQFPTSHTARKLCECVGVCTCKLKSVAVSVERRAVEKRRAEHGKRMLHREPAVLTPGFEHARSIVFDGEAQRFDEQRIVVALGPPTPRAFAQNAHEQHEVGGSRAGLIGLRQGTRIVLRQTRRRNLTQLPCYRRAPRARIEAAVPLRERAHIRLQRPVTIRALAAQRRERCACDVAFGNRERVGLKPSEIWTENARLRCSSSSIRLARYGAAKFGLSRYGYPAP